MKNDGTSAQDEFEAKMKLLGKEAVVHRITDSKEVSGMRAGLTGRSFRDSMVKTKSQPADYFVIQKHIGGYFAEVKSTGKPRFSFSMLRAEQWSMGIRASVANETGYFIFVRYEVTKEWWRIPFHRIRTMADEGHKSISFRDLNNAGLQWRV